MKIGIVNTVKLTKVLKSQNKGQYSLEFDGSMLGLMCIKKYITNLVQSSKSISDVKKKLNQ